MARCSNFQQDIYLSTVICTTGLSQFSVIIYD